ncbi:MAG: hypothetical protein GY835_22950 [bacterium]|nr:hypothetical protein [bacterium]
MRFLRRHELEAVLSDYLDRMQRVVDEGADIVATWKAQRRSRFMKRIVEELGRMTGARERCMFCEDSRGTDIEHFWPKKRYPEKSFRWSWACPGVYHGTAKPTARLTAKRALNFQKASGDDPRLECSAGSTGRRNITAWIICGHSHSMTTGGSVRHVTFSIRIFRRVDWQRQNDGTGSPGCRQWRRRPWPRSEDAMRHGMEIIPGG